MGLANAFSGGLFLAIALVHILPEVTQEYNEYIEDGHDHNHTHTTVTLMQSANQVLVQHGNHYHLVNESSAAQHPILGHGGESHAFPLPFVLVFAGYSFILMIDRVMFDSHSLLGGHDHGGKGDGHGHGHGHGNITEHGHGD